MAPAANLSDRTNNNAPNGSHLDTLPPADGDVEASAVKVISTIPPDGTYSKLLYPFTPLRLLPMSRFADVGRCYEWTELKQKACVHPLLPRLSLSLHSLPYNFRS